MWCLVLIRINFGFSVLLKDTWAWGLGGAELNHQQTVYYLSHSHPPFHLRQLLLNSWFISALTTAALSSLIAYLARLRFREVIIPTQSQFFRVCFAFFVYLMFKLSALLYLYLYFIFLSIFLLDVLFCFLALLKLPYGNYKTSVLSCLPTDKAQYFHSKRLNPI